MKTVFNGAITEADTDLKTINTDINKEETIVRAGS